MKIIPYGKQYIDRKDITEVTKALGSELITTGQYVKKLENFVRNEFNVKYALTCSSGTAGLHLAFLSISLKKNDIVIMPSVNFIASFNLCSSLGAKVHFADVDATTGQMTPKTILECIRKNKINKIKLIITMYLGGYPENIEYFNHLRKKFKCLLIEDACHALGAKYKIKNILYAVGQCAHSDICVFSMHPLKTITSGEGGIITTKNKDIYNRILKLRSHGIERNIINHWKYEIKEQGFNYRLSDINCALAISQFQKMNTFIDYRKKVFNLYRKLFQKSDFITFPTYSTNNFPSYHLVIAQFNFKNLNQTKDKFLEYLKKNKIYAQFHYIPIYKFKLCKNKKKLLFSEKYFEQTISLPIYFNLKNSHIQRVVKVINQFYKRNIHYAK